MKLLLILVLGIYVGWVINNIVQIHAYLTIPMWSCLPSKRWYE